jgi:hypothetical protein
MKAPLIEEKGRGALFAQRDLHDGGMWVNKESIRKTLGQRFT